MNGGRYWWACQAGDCTVRQTEGTEAEAKAALHRHLDRDHAAPVPDDLDDRRRDLSDLRCSAGSADDVAAEYAA